jgi:serine/tyrosine/threonine adenylyltransferase
MKSVDQPSMFDPAEVRPIPFDNSYARLPDRFYAPIMPTPVSAAQLIALNRPLADELGLAIEGLPDEAAAEIFTGNQLLPGAEPIALAYAGHQFGHFVPQLGDGRAILIGEVIDRAGERRDIQLKGAGPTPFSRNGDGRAALGPVLREYIVSEAMHALGIRTTRALAACLTGERVQREAALPGGVITRVARSHIRVGTFQYFAARQDGEGLGLLADHVIARHYPEAATAQQPYSALFEAIIGAQAALVASWMRVGFIHGVMNTDNCSIAGETIDYGPCAFLDSYHPDKVFSSIDRGGRYAFGNQSLMAQWNMARLAEAMLPLLGESADEALEFARDAVESFTPQFAEAYRAAMAPKLGLSPHDEGVDALIAATLDLMAQHNIDYSLFFSGLDEDRAVARALFGEVEPEFDVWAARWSAARASSSLSPQDGAAAMASSNPRIIPRNHQIEAMIASAIEQHDFSSFARLNSALASPYAAQPIFADLATPPLPHERVAKTFCGT